MNVTFIQLVPWGYEVMRPIFDLVRNGILITSGFVPLSVSIVYHIQHKLRISDFFYWRLHRYVFPLEKLEAVMLEIFFTSSPNSFFLLIKDGNMLTLV